LINIECATCGISNLLRLEVYFDCPELEKLGCFLISKRVLQVADYWVKLVVSHACHLKYSIHMNNIRYHKRIDCTHIHIKLSKVPFKSLKHSLWVVKSEQDIVLCNFYVGSTRINKRLWIVYLQSTGILSKIGKICQLHPTFKIW